MHLPPTPGRPPATGAGGATTDVHHTFPSLGHGTLTLGVSPSISTSKCPGLVGVPYPPPESFSRPTVEPGEWTLLPRLKFTLPPPSVCTPSTSCIRPPNRSRRSFGFAAGAGLINDFGTRLPEDQLPGERMRAAGETPPRLFPACIPQNGTVCPRQPPFTSRTRRPVFALSAQ